MIYARPTLLFLFSFIANFAIAQSGQSNLLLPLSACVGENILFESQNPEVQLRWDFCSGDLLNGPSINSVATVSGAIGRPEIEFVKDGDIWIAFVTGTWTNSLQRLTFANGVDNPPTDIYNLGDLNGNLNGPGAIRVIYSGTNWLAIIHNTSSGELLKLNFGDKLSNVPFVSVVANGVGYGNSGLALERDNQDWICLITNASNRVTILRLGTDLSPPGSNDVLETGTLPNANNLHDIDVIRSGGSWYGFVNNFGNGTLCRLDFGHSLFSLPIVEQIATLDADNYGKLKVAREGEDFFLFTTSLTGFFTKLIFGNDPSTSPTVSKENSLQGNVPMNNYGLSIVNEGSRWFVFTIDLSAAALSKISYPQNCSASVESSLSGSPAVAYSTPGMYKVTLESTIENETVIDAGELEISPLLAPAINFSSYGACVSHEIIFTTETSDLQTVEPHWDFGDTYTSDIPNPSHVFSAPGIYPVTLILESTNGCANRLVKHLKVYDIPNADFALPTTPVCTNNPINFEGQILDTFDEMLVFQWYLNDLPASQSRDFYHTFTMPGDHTIKLVTSIPGCSSEVTKVIEDVGEGPLISFNYDGLTCEYETMQFESSIIGDVDHLNWDFAGLSQSTELTPSKTFPAGTHPVSLTATGTNGCVSTVSQPLKVFAKPIVAFDTESPLLCENATLKFVDASTPIDGYLSLWSWSLGDQGSSFDQHPEVTFTEAGDQLITLTVENNHGCSSSTSSTINIKPQPEATISHDNLCINVPVTFASSDDPQAREWKWTIDNKIYSSQNATHTFRTGGLYSANLMVVGSNGCENETETSVQIYPALVPTIVSEKNCVGTEASLIDITASEDEIISRQWQIGNDIFAANPLHYTFSIAGTKEVSLTLQTNSGCSYTKVIPVDVVEAPEASFMISSPIGSPQMEFVFENRSKYATSYNWDFNDGNVYEGEAAVHSFTSVGNFNVKLVATNDRGCSDSFTRPVAITAPSPGMSVLAVTTTEPINNAINIHVVLENDGNTTFENLPVTIDVSGILKLSEIIPDKIYPKARYNLDLQYNIVDDGQLKFICAEAVVDLDAAPDNNRNCISIEEQLTQFFPVYPNPVVDAVNFEWLADDNEKINISIISSMGETLITRVLDSRKGLNSISIPIERLKNGVYLMVIESDQRKTTQRILVSN